MSEKNAVIAAGAASVPVVLPCIATKRQRFMLVRKTKLGQDGAGTGDYRGNADK
jgi:hypothetical protein